MLRTGEKENFFMLMVQLPERQSGGDTSWNTGLSRMSGSMFGYPLDTAKGADMEPGNPGI